MMKNSTREDRYAGEETGTNTQKGIKWASGYEELYSQGIYTATESDEGGVENICRRR
jgi:hypothetical protein